MGRLRVKRKLCLQLTLPVPECEWEGASSRGILGCQARWRLAIALALESGSVDNKGLLVGGGYREQNKFTWEALHDVQD
jgi:hypothetical protein